MGERLSDGKANFQKHTCKNIHEINIILKLHIVLFHIDRFNICKPHGMINTADMA